MTKKMTLLSVLLAALCATAEDSYMYWMVSEEAKLGETELVPTKDDNWTAKVVAIGPDAHGEWTYGGGTYLNIYSTGLGGTLGSDLGSSGVALTLDDGYLPYYVNLASSAGEGWTYFVELYNDGRIFAHSEKLPYSEESIAIMSGMAAPGKIWMMSAFVPAAAPEPNSALLVLIGCAALALRRRKRMDS